MHPWEILQILILLAVANGTPVIAKDILGNFLSFPLDARLKFIDGRPLLGTSKTIRGIVLSVLMTSASALLLGWSWKVGFLAGSTAMGGDLFSSFLKRRLNLPSGGRATGLDQIPESLFPLLACRNLLSLSIADIVVCVGIFFIGEVLLSRLLFKFHLRDRPY